MTKYIKLGLLTLVGVMFSSVVYAGITHLWDPYEYLTHKRKQETAVKTCAARGYFNTSQSGMTCYKVTLMGGLKCFSCECDLEEFKYTSENCNGDKEPVITKDSCVNPSNNIVHYSECACKDSSQEIVNGKCEAKCPAYAPRKANGECECSDTGATYYPSTQECKCKSNYEEFDGKCLPVCSAGKKRAANGKCQLCVDTVNAYYEGGERDECVCMSTLRQMDSDGMCRCIEGYVENESGECVRKTSGGCSSGFIMINGVCQKCPEDSTYSDGQCVCSDPNREIYVDDEGNISCECKEGYEYDALDCALHGECNCELRNDCDESEVKHPDTGVCIDPMNCYFDMSTCSSVPNMSSGAGYTCEQRYKGSMPLIEKCNKARLLSGLDEIIICADPYPLFVCCGENEVVQDNKCVCQEGYSKDSSGVCKKASAGGGIDCSTPHKDLGKCALCRGAMDYNYCMCGSYGKYYHASTGKCTNSPSSNGSGGTGNDAFQTTGGSANPNNMNNGVNTNGVDILR